MKVKKHRTSAKEKVRNFLLILLALATVVVFFNLDISTTGESVFSKSSTKKLRFRGDLKREAYTEKEIASLTRFIDKYKNDIERAEFQVMLQDTYKKIKDSSQLTFEVRLTMDDGATINTPTWRTTRGKMIPSMLAKMKKDMKAYLELKKQGKKMKSFVNTK